MSRTRSIFNKALRAKIVELSYIFPSAAELARQLNIRPELLYRWRSQFPSMGNANPNQLADMDMSEMEELVARLKEEIQNHKQEQDLLIRKMNDLALLVPKVKDGGHSSNVPWLIRIFGTLKQSRVSRNMKKLTN